MKEVLLLKPRNLVFLFVGMLSLFQIAGRNGSNAQQGLGIFLGRTLDASFPSLPLLSNVTADSKNWNTTSTSTRIPIYTDRSGTVDILDPRTPSSPIGTRTSNINHTWEPSNEWIRECIQDQKKNNKKLRQKYRVQWKHYQLGDCVKLCMRCVSSFSASQFGNLSIAGQYWEHVCHRKGENKIEFNVTYLKQLFETIEQNPHPYNKPWPRPAEDELVIHLRIGDIMDDSKYVGDASVFDMLKSGVDTRHGENAIYPRGIKSIHEYLSTIQESGLEKVVLRGGSHFAKPYPKSRIFSSCLAKAIQTAGYNLTSVQVDGEDDPDQDFYYMSYAKHFVSATGGYSQMIAQLVEHLGGVIVGRRFPKGNNDRIKDAILRGWQPAV